MTSQIKRTGSLIVSLVILVAAFVVYNSFVRGELDLISDLQGELAAKKEAVVDQRIVTEQVKNLITKFKSVEAIERTVSLSIPKSEDTAGLLRQINTITRANNLDSRVISFRVVPGSRSAGGTANPNVVEMNIQFSGTYEQLKSFLNAIERNVRIMDVFSLKIGIPNFVTDRIDADLVIVAYFAAPKNSVPQFE